MHGIYVWKFHTFLVAWKIWKADRRSCVAANVLRLGKCFSSCCSASSAKPRQPVKLSSTTCLEMSAAKALRRSVGSSPCATKPNHEARAKCAASAWFLNWKPFPIEHETQQTSKNKTRCVHHIPTLIEKIAQRLVSQQNNLDLEAAPRQPAPTGKTQYKTTLPNLLYFTIYLFMNSLWSLLIP